MGGPVKISCLAINEICCSITDRFCFAGTQVGDIIIRTGAERSNLTRSQPILRPQRTAPPHLANYKNIRDPCFNVGRQFSRRQVAVGMLEALGPSWSGLHLLKLSLKCFAMIRGGGGARQRAEELVLPLSLQTASCKSNLPASDAEIIETLEFDLHSHFPA